MPLISPLPSNATPRVAMLPVWAMCGGAGPVTAMYQYAWARAQALAAQPTLILPAGTPVAFDPRWN